MASEDSISNERLGAEEVARAREDLAQLAHSVSHDLQEPLRMVSSYCQLLQRRYQGKLDDEADEFIEYAVDGTRRMRLMIAGLLRFSRVTTHGRSFQPTEMSAVLGRIVRGLSEEITGAGGIVTSDLLPCVNADEAQMAQLLQELIDNALRYRSQQAPQIHISAERIGEKCILSVDDNGVGIDPQYWSRVFGVFQSLHTREEHPGTGMGLAICKRIVERHGGRIWLESEPGQGSTFFFSMPSAGGC